MNSNDIMLLYYMGCPTSTSCRLSLTTVCCLQYRPSVSSRLTMDHARLTSLCGSTTARRGAARLSSTGAAVATGTDSSASPPVSRLGGGDTHAVRSCVRCTASTASRPTNMAVPCVPLVQKATKRMMTYKSYDMKRP